MSTVTECAYERTVRVESPVDDLYEEIDSVHRLARFIPQLASDVEGTSDTTGDCRGVLAIGPLSYEVDGQLLVEPVSPMHNLEVALRAPALRLELDGVLALSPGANNETTLHYSATLRSTHPVLRRMPKALSGVLEEHVDTTTDLIAVRGRQYTQARRALTEPD